MKKMKDLILKLIAKYKANKKRNPHVIVEKLVPSLREQPTMSEFELFRKGLVCNYDSQLYIVCNTEQMMSMNILGRTSNLPI